jgi:type I restriction enzyme, S subunit
VSQSIRLRYLFTDRMGGAWGDEPEPGNSVVCIRAADFETHAMSHTHEDLTRRTYSEAEFERKQLKIGDLIIEKSGGGDNQPVGRTIIFDLPEPATCSNFLEIIRPNQNILLTKFGCYLMYSLWASRYVEKHIKKTTGIQNLDSESYFDQHVLLPPLEVQKRIADYLDSETTQIDALILEKERMLKLLEEKRAALISQAVTKGLNPSVPLKESGLEWLGKIPEHWKLERAKQFFTLREEVSEAGEEELLTVSHITGVTSRAEKDVNMFKAEDMTGYKRCQPGDFVINTLWAWMGAMGIAWQEGIVSPAYHIYTPGEQLKTEYVELLCRSKPFVAEVIRFSKGVWSSRLRLYPESFLDIKIPVPPLDEQSKIIETIAIETRKNSEFKKELEYSLKLLSERRSALITSAVTGQLEFGEVKS